MDMQKYYGGEEKSMAVESPAVRVSTTTIEEYGEQKIPEGARVVSVDKNITIKKIENGWLKEVNTYTSYRMKDDEDMGYANNYHCRYFTEKPNDEQTAYSEY